VSGEEEMKAPLEELEELVEPGGEQISPPLLAEGTLVQNPEQGVSYRVERVLRFQGWQPPYNIYEVVEAEASTTLAEQTAETAPVESLDEKTQQEFEQRLQEAKERVQGQRATPFGAEGSETSPLPTFWLWEASPSSAASLQREANILTQLNVPMFPKVRAIFQRNGNLYMVTEALPEQTLMEAMERRELTFPQFLTVLSQIAYALSQLHQIGWVHLGLRPQVVLLGKPLKLVDLRWATRIGEKISTPFYHCGYSPPELLQADQTVDERSDIFSVGALLYHFLNGQPIPETGVQLIGWQSTYSGVPQILHRCLGSKEERYPKMQVLHQEILRLKNRYTPSVTYSVFGATIIGLEPSRTSNQDAFGYLEGTMQSEAGKTGWLVACVADGMGGMEGGEVASEVAVKTVLSEAAVALTNSVPSIDEHPRIVKEWVHKANEKVCEALERRRAKGGTTLLCCLLVGKKLAIAHVGDCRLYLVRDGKATLLTRDHSLAMALALQEGKVDPDALRHHPDRSRLTRSLGDRSPMPDYFVDSLEVTVGKAVTELETGDILLLCSDGLWEPVSEGEMVTILGEHPDNLPEAAKKLLGLALERGANDNATVLLIRVGESPLQG